MSARLPLRTVAVETCIGMGINAAAATLPILLSSTTAAPQPLQAAAAGFAPQILAGAFMSVAAPALRAEWRRWRLGGRCDAAAPILLRTAATALVLAAAFTAGILSFVHLALPALVGEIVDRPTSIVLAGAQGVLAAALLTPLTFASLRGRIDR